MLHKGRFPLTVHAIAEYAAGVLLIVAPFLLSFENGTATAVSIVLGVLVLAVAASTEWPIAVMPALPLPFHLALDFAVAGVLVASPFVFGFSDETAPTAFFIVLGVVHLLLTLGTRFEGAADDGGGGRSGGLFGSKDDGRSSSSSSSTTTTS